MAHIDELVRKVPDPQLRAALEEQVRTITERREFGLVFQKHAPEAIRLPQQRIRRGDTVELRDEAKGSPRYRVVETKASEGWGAVVQLDTSGEPAGEAEHMLKTDLVVVKEFGQPVYPGLRQVGEAGEAKPGQPTHVVINGENYHALQALEYTHAGKVDLIYIDPPYNTGNADWKYNDRYVDGQDAYRHSKWLSFMERRLHIAKRLLKDTGVIILAIDDNEHHRLRMLTDRIFEEGNFLADITWQGATISAARFSGGGADYMLVYAKDKSVLIEQDVVWRESKRGLPEVLAAGQSAWAESGANAGLATSIFRGWLRANKEILDPGMLMYNNIGSHGEIYRLSDVSAPSRQGQRFDILHPVTRRPVKVPSSGWSMSQETAKQWLDEGRFVFGPDESTVPQQIKTLDGARTRQVVAASFVSHRAPATKHMINVLGDKRFPFPKDHEVLMRWFRMVAPNDAVVVDFFAGSGTTAEAVVRLNAEDGGARQCILVTNNELSKVEDAKLRKQGFRPGDEEYEALGVFHHVTKPRLATVLTGVREDGSKYSEGVPGQKAAFFDLTYEDENLVALGRRFEAIAPLLWMQAGARGDMIEKITDWGYDAPAGANYAIIFDTTTAADCIASLHEGIQHVFVVTDSEADFRGVAAGLPKRLQGTAQHLYANYLRSFEINRG